MLKVPSVIFHWSLHEMALIYERELAVAGVADQCQQLGGRRGNRAAFKLSKQTGLFRELVSVNVKVMANRADYWALEDFCTLLN